MAEEARVTIVEAATSLLFDIIKKIPSADDPDACLLRV